MTYGSIEQIDQARHALARLRNALFERGAPAVDSPSGWQIRAALTRAELEIDEDEIRLIAAGAK